MLRAFLLAITLSFQILHAWEFKDNQGQNFSLETCLNSDLDACRTVFVAAFSQAYTDFSEEDLGVNNKLAFLESAFDSLYNDVITGQQDLLVVKDQDCVIGLVGFKATEVERQYYISQLAVHPDYWGRSIGFHLVTSVFQLYQSVESLLVMPRKINLRARHFYLSLGFHESSYIHAGYDPNKYTGFEWNKEIQNTSALL